MPWVFDVGGSERFKAASGRPYFSNDCRAEPPTFWWTPSGPSLAAIFRPFWPRSPPNGWLPQPDGIRHRNSEREYLATGLTYAFAGRAHSPRNLRCGWPP